MTSASLCVAKIVTKFCDQDLLLDNKTEFSIALGTPRGKRKQWEDLYKIATSSYGAYEHFLNLLEDWIERRGSRATLGELRLVLEECEFIAALESLESLGVNETTIKITQGAASPTIKPIYFGVALPTSYFVGREEEVEQLSQLLINRQPPVVVISGMGGQGKTELCRQFIHGLKDKDPISLIWLNGDTASNLTFSLTRLSSTLQIPVTTEGRPVPLHELVINASDKISTNSSNGWLVVIDNVDEMYPEFKQTVPVLISRGAFVLVTSRRIDILSSEAKQIKLDVLKDGDAHNLISTILGQLLNEDDVKSLYKELGNHALALRQATAYIIMQQNENRSSYSIKNYLDEFNKDKLLLDNQVNFIDGYDLTIFVIMTRTMVTISDNHGQKGRTAVEVMQILCLILPDGISTQTLKTIVDASQLFESDASSETKNDELHQVLLLLKKYSLISYDGESFLSIHRLVQKVAKSTKSNYLKLIIKEIRVDESSPEEARQLASVWGHSDPATVQEYADFPRRLFHQMNDLSMIPELREFSINNFKLFHEILGEDHKETLLMGYNVGLALRANGYPEAALPIFEEVFERETRIFGDLHPETQNTVGNIADVLRELGRYAEALGWTQTVLRYRIRVNGNDSEITMLTRHNLALILKQLGHLEEALQINKEVLEWRRENLGESHRSTLVSRHNIAAIFYDQGRFEEAKAEFEAVTRMKEELLGKEHVDTITSRLWVARTLWPLGKRDEALAVLEEIERLQIKTLGPSHPSTVFTRDKICEWKATL